MSGRDLQANDRRDARAHSSRARTQGASRLTNTNATASPFVHDVRAAGRLACVKVTDRHAAVDYAHTLKDCPTPISRRGEDRAGAG